MTFTMLNAIFMLAKPTIQQADALQWPVMAYSKIVTLLVVVLVLTGYSTSNAMSNQKQDNVPEFDTATPLPYPYTNYAITDDGFLIEEGDIVQSCEELPYREGALHEALVKACTKAGFPPDGTLPDTGGPVTDVFPLQSDGNCPPPLVKQSGACHPR